jgi:prostaglandin-endoperoxide synthase 2
LENTTMNDFKYGVREFFHGNRNYVMDVFRSISRAIVAVLSVPWAILGPPIMVVALQLAHILHKRAPDLWGKLLRPQLIRRLVSRATISRFGNITEPRPHPFSMRADYPTWTAMVVHKWTGRHLPPFKPGKRDPVRPDLQELEHLFMRPVPVGGQIDDIRSNLLFASFAQWFTDSFLRTSHKLAYDRRGNTEVLPDGTKKRAEGHRRERENESNHEIDLCQIYGMNEAQTNILRFRPGDPGYNEKRHKGTLKSQICANGEEFPAALLACAPKVPKDSDDTRPRTKLDFAEPFVELYADEKLLRSIFSSAIHNPNGYELLFACGLEHGNSTIGNSLFNTIFLRHHNYVAREIAAAHPDFDDDEVFEKTRNVMIVLLLKIVVSDYVRHISPLDLPFVVPPKVADGQNWYRRNRIHFEFNLLYRWHSLIPDVFPFLGDLDNPLKNFTKFRHNNHWLIDQGVKSALYHFMDVPAGKMTLGNTPQALRLVKRDTLKLMRAANLASYNDYRERFGLHRVTSFEEVTGETVIAAALSDLYEGQIDDLEFYIGLVAERHRSDGIMGDLLLRMVAHDAFTHALTNPLLAEEMQAKLPGYKKPGEHVFSRRGVEIISGIESLHELVSNVVPDLDAGRRISFRKPGTELN